MAASVPFSVTNADVCLLGSWRKLCDASKMSSLVPSRLRVMDEGGRGWLGTAGGQGAPGSQPAAPAPEATVRRQAEGPAAQQSRPLPNGFLRRLKQRLLPNDLCPVSPETLGFGPNQLPAFSEEGRGLGLRWGPSAIFLPFCHWMAERGLCVRSRATFWVL